jgi:cell division GTPase FtsZ
MVWILLCALLLTLCLREVRDSAIRARYRTVGREVVSSLEKMFFSAIYPGYRYERSITFASSCRRRWRLFGPLMVVVRTRFRPNIHLDVRNFVIQRIHRLGREDYAKKPVLVSPVFTRAKRLTQSSRLRQRERSHLTGQKERTMEEKSTNVTPLHSVGSQEPVPQPEAPDEELVDLIRHFKLNEDVPRATWLSFGGSSKNVVSMLLDTLDPETHKFTQIIGANTDVQQYTALLRSTGEARPRFLKEWGKLSKEKESRFQLMQLGKDGAGSGGNPQVAAGYVREKREQICKAIDSSKIAILVSNLGGGTGSGAAPEIAAMLAEKKDGIGSLAILIMPFGFEGEARFKRAEEAHQKVTEHIAVVTIYNQALYELSENPRFAPLAARLKEMTTDEVIQEMNKRSLAPTIDVLNQLIMYAASAINRDPADFTRIAQSGKAVYIGSYDSTAEDAPEGTDEIIEDLLDNPFLDPGIVPEAEVGMILFRGFKHEEAETIASRIREAMQGDDTAKVVELIPGYDKGEEGKKSIFFMAVAKEQADLRRSYAHVPVPHSKEIVQPRGAATEASQSANSTNKKKDLDPFKSITIESLRPSYKGKMRSMSLRFEDQYASQEVWLSPKVMELVQYFEANWARWTESELKENYALLREFFETIHPETLGKRWLSEGISASNSSAPAAEQMAASKAKLISSFLPVRSAGANQGSKRKRFFGK